MSRAGADFPARRVSAIARRDIRIQRTYQFQLLLLLADIPLVLFTYFYLGRLVGDAPGLAAYRGGYFEFALIGFVVTSFATAALSAFSAGVVAKQQSGTLEILLATPGTRLRAILGGSFVVPFGIAALQAVALFATGWVVSGSRFDTGGLLLALPLVALTAATFCALGVVAAAGILLTKRGDPISALAVQATNLVAGAVFPVALLPGALRSAARLFPAYHGFNGLREVLLAGGGIGDVAGDLAVLCLFAAISLPISQRIFVWAVRVGRMTGTLGGT